MRKGLLIIATLTLLSSASPAALGWGMFGSHEPDTPEDAANGWMWTTTDTSRADHKVYFNGFFGQCANGSCTGLNPNVATLGSSVHTPEYLDMAMLGVWRDCNDDGYVGLEDQGLFEYRSEVLAAWPGVGNSICPPGEAPLPVKNAQGYYNKGGVSSEGVLPHNDGTWVHELIPIQWFDDESPVFDHDPYNYDDQGSRVWMDQGLEPQYSIGCYYTSWPTGTFRSTGGLLHTFDCIDGYRATDTLDAVATGPLAPYSFADAPRDQARSSSQLNQANPWGNERSDASYADMWDCSQQPLVGGGANTMTVGPVSESNVGTSRSGSATGIGTLSDSNTDEYNVSRPAVPPATHLVAPTVRTSGQLYDGNGYSMAGTMNATGSGLDTCARNPHADQHNHEGDSLGTLPYDEVTTTETSARTQPDDTMFPVERNRPCVPYCAVEGPWGPTGDLGIHWLPGDCHDTGVCDLAGVWEGNRVWHQETLFTSDSGVHPVAHMTYYAYVSPTAISQFQLYLPKAPAPAQASPTGAYGAEACGSFTTGVHNGWDCDSTHWYKDAVGTDVTPRTRYLGPDRARIANGYQCAEYGNNFNPDAGCMSYGVLPGQPYDLQDIDCYDQSVTGAREAGVGYGALTGTSCEDS
jgi:hypothetical protein